VEEGPSEATLRRRAKKDTGPSTASATGRPSNSSARDAGSERGGYSGAMTAVKNEEEAWEGGTDGRGRGEGSEGSQTSLRRASGEDGETGRQREPHPAPSFNGSSPDGIKWSHPPPSLHPQHPYPYTQRVANPHLAAHDGHAPPLAPFPPPHQQSFYPSNHAQHPFPQQPFYFSVPSNVHSDSIPPHRHPSDPYPLQPSQPSSYPPRSHQPIFDDYQSIPMPHYNTLPPPAPYDHRPSQSYQQEPSVSVASQQAQLNRYREQTRSHHQQQSRSVSSSSSDPSLHDQIGSQPLSFQIISSSGTSPETYYTHPSKSSHAPSIISPTSSHFPSSSSFPNTISSHHLYSHPYSHSQNVPSYQDSDEHSRDITTASSSSSYPHQQQQQTYPSDISPIESQSSQPHSRSLTASSSFSASTNGKRKASTLFADLPSAGDASSSSSTLAYRRNLRPIVGLGFGMEDGRTAAAGGDGLGPYATLSQAQENDWQEEDGWAVGSRNGLEVVVSSRPFCFWFAPWLSSTMADVTS
jgi:hypothetical protein